MSAIKSSLQVPPGKVATVRIIDSTSSIKMLPVRYLMEPPIAGFEHMPELPTWSFLIEHESGRKLLFDLGIPVDWPNLAPAVSDKLKSSGWVVNVQKPTADILREQSIDPAAIEAIVWSHWHWDHIGNPEQFPGSTKLIVGPGFREGMLPAYPENPKSNVRESDFKGRELQEITFEEPGTVKVGQFRAHDYFGDGSFYLLDTPGHAIGHLGGLVRTTTNPDTFIFCGGDLSHHSGEMRPSKYLRLPKEIDTNILSLGGGAPCPGAVFEELQHSRSRKPDEPFFAPAMGLDIEEVKRTIAKTQEADGDDNILYLFAHDGQLRRVGDFFPATANDWKVKGWREKLQWAFLEDFKQVLNHKSEL